MEPLSNHLYLSHVFLKCLRVNYLAGTEFCNRSLNGSGNRRDCYES